MHLSHIVLYGDCHLLLCSHDNLSHIVLYGDCHLLLCSHDNLSHIVLYGDCHLLLCSHDNTNSTLIVRLYLLHTIWNNSDMFQSILIVFRELLNIDKAYIKT